MLIKEINMVMCCCALHHTPF